MSCRFLSDGDYLGEDTLHRKLRLLMIKFHNGFKGTIYVTAEAPFSLTLGTGRVLNIWHYELSPDGKQITLTGVGNNSVQCLSSIDGHEFAHETVSGWPLETLPGQPD